MILRELFNTPVDTRVDFEIDSSGNGVTKYWFKVGEPVQSFCIEFRRETWFQDKNKYCFSVIFFREYQGIGFKKSDITPDEDIETDQRTVLQIWSTVGESLIDFLQKVRPNLVYFGASSQSLAKMYDTALKRFKDKFEAIGYETGVSSQFFIRRKF
jgi:hypothetical protein